MKVYTHKTYSYVKVVEISKDEVERVDLCICNQPKETLGNFYSRQEVKPDVLINAGFFALSSGDSCFNLIDDGHVYSSNTLYRWGMGIDADHKWPLYGSLDQNKNKFVDFISGYPVLLDNGAACSYSYAAELNYNASRSIFGYNDSTMFIVTIDSPGMNFPGMIALMQGLGCKYAINLDGGGSTRLMVGGEVVNKPKENRAVDSVLAVYVKDALQDDKDYYIYTVVLGDSWWRIAANELGSGLLYTKLQEYNDWAPNRVLRPGDGIKIPKNKFQEPQTIPPDEETIVTENKKLSLEHVVEKKITKKYTDASTSTTTEKIIADEIRFIDTETNNIVYSIPLGEK